jgi:hypothetical protein
MVRLAQKVLLSYTNTDAVQMDWNKIPLDPRHQWVPSGASKTISEPMVRSKQTVHLSCIKIGTISKIDRIELALKPRQLRVPLGASKTISEPTVHLAQTVHLSAPTLTLLQMDRNEIPHDPRHLGVLSGVS